MRNIINECHKENDKNTKNASISLSQLVLELLVKRYGLCTEYEPHQIAKVEKEIILEAERLKQRSINW